MNYCVVVVLKFLENVRVVIPRMYDFFSNYETAINLEKHRGLVWSILERLNILQESFMC